MKIKFKRNLTRKDIPNTWRRLATTIGGKTHYSASIICSNGHYGVITDHKISNEGIVTPSVVCPQEDCNFHEYITLEGWSKLQ